MIAVKTGMQDEMALARFFAAPGTVVFSGQMSVSDFKESIPAWCRGIISFGLCGGLAPGALVGETFVYSSIITPSGNYPCDQGWTQRIIEATQCIAKPCWSSGQFNTANTINQREALFAKTNCWLIDDESRAVAEFAKQQGIALAGLRAVSDGARDNLPIAVINALNPDGSNNIEAVLKSVISDPTQIPALLKTYQEYKVSIDSLRKAALRMGPYFQWN